MGPLQSHFQLLRDFCPERSAVLAEPRPIAGSKRNPKPPMPLLGLNGVSLTFTGPLILDNVTLQIDEGERIGLLGRNGAGKSTLLRVLEGRIRPDSGDLVRAQSVRVASLQQDVPEDLPGTVREYLLSECAHANLDSPWETETRIDQIVDQLTLDPNEPAASLSAGSKRRLLLAVALVLDPDLLILDEPTNHLDLDAIEHLEDALRSRRGALIFVTHDRAFLRRLATRILDLDRGVLRSYRVGYDAYLEKREEQLRVEGEQAALFDKQLAQEEAWLRRGIKARRTRNEGRVRALQALRRERSARREEPGRLKADLQEAEKSGRIVLRWKDLEFGYTEAPIVKQFSGTILRGDRIGIIGPNGSGKTTLIRLLLGELAPQKGAVIQGAKVEIARFEQLHDALDESRTVLENVSEGRERIPTGGGERHIVGYLHDFLFTSEQIQGPITRLSGGERKRLQLAKILSRPCNVLVLDEPTNDLDLETLELLEDMLLEFDGTLLVVSHDRDFLDNVVTSTLVFEGDGRWQDYVGGYQDWLRQRKPEEKKQGSKAARARAAAPRDATARAGSTYGATSGAGSASSGSTSSKSADSGSTSTSSNATAARPRRLGFNETRELDGLPARIERLEAEKATLLTLLSSPDFYRSPGEEIAQRKARLDTLDAEIEHAYERWAELESIKSGV